MCLCIHGVVVEAFLSWDGVAQALLIHILIMSISSYRAVSTSALVESCAQFLSNTYIEGCLLYTSDAADDSLRVDLGGRRII